MSLTTSILQGGTNSHSTTSEEVNYDRTDLMSPGVVGVLTNTAGVSPATGGFAVNAQGSPNATVAVSAGVCNVTATPNAGNSQLLRVKNSASTNVTIAANAAGGTRFDWVYVQIDATKAQNPASDASDVATLVTSRSTSATTDNGTPPTYGTLLAVVTVANGFSTITNGNIADKRVRVAAVGGVNDTNGNEELRVIATTSAVNDITITNAATGTAPLIQSSGDDTNIDIKIKPKGTGRVELGGAGVAATNTVATSQTTASTSYTDLATTGPTVTVTIGSSGLAIIILTAELAPASGDSANMGFVASGANTIAAADTSSLFTKVSAASPDFQGSWAALLTGLTAGSTVFTAKYRVNAGTGTFLTRVISVIPL